MNDNTNLQSPPAPTVWPSVDFVDVDAGIRFLTEGLGFVVTADYRGDDGTVEHAEARWPDGGGSCSARAASPVRGGALGPQGVYVVALATATVDAAWDLMTSMDNVDIVTALHDTDYGSHEFGVRDGDGSLWTMGRIAGRSRSHSGTSSAPFSQLHRIFPADHCSDHDGAANAAGLSVSGRSGHGQRLLM